MAKLTPALEALLLLKLPKVMALPCNEYDAYHCAFCGQESGSYGRTVLHTADCLGVALLERLGKKGSSR